MAGNQCLGSWDESLSDDYVSTWYTAISDDPDILHMQFA
jgi:hypothetical protein